MGLESPIIVQKRVEFTGYLTRKPSDKVGSKTDKNRLMQKEKIPRKYMKLVFFIGGYTLITGLN